MAAISDVLFLFPSPSPSPSLSLFSLSLCVFLIPLSLCVFFFSVVLFSLAVNLIFCLQELCSAVCSMKEVLCLVWAVIVSLRTASFLSCGAEKILGLRDPKKGGVSVSVE